MYVGVGASSAGEGTGASASAGGVEAVGTGVRSSIGARVRDAHATRSIASNATTARRSGGLSSRDDVGELRIGSFSSVRGHTSGDTGEQRYKSYRIERLFLETRGRHFDHRQALVAAFVAGLRQRQHHPSA